jgi:y4mF family transcriptional regulator
MEYDSPGIHLITPDREWKECPLTSRFEHEIGAFVRERRKASRLNQRELGELAGVGARFVSELERDKPTVRLDSVNKVLSVFGKRLGIVDAPKGDESSP